MSYLHLHHASFKLVLVHRSVLNNVLGSCRHRRHFPLVMDIRCWFAMFDRWILVWSLSAASCTSFSWIWVVKKVSPIVAQIGDHDRFTVIYLKENRVSFLLIRLDWFPPISNFSFSCPTPIWSNFCVKLELFRNCQSFSGSKSNKCSSCRCWSFLCMELTLIYRLSTNLVFESISHSSGITSW